MDKQELLNILVEKQLKDVTDDDRLNFSDIIRLTKFLGGSIFKKNGCVKWYGYYEKNRPNWKRHRSSGITFFFKGNKRMLHRLLYINFKGNIPPNTHVYFSCENGPYCCNINHMFLRKYDRITSDKKSKLNDNIFKINHDVIVHFD